MKSKISEKIWFKYVVIAAVLLIPFMYSFFYLKAYWNPYGEGNIDNLPVAIVNSDKGDKGDSLISNIKKSKKLKLSVVSEDKADEGLNDGTYYAVINIPEDFTSNMESASTNNKKHATITYSPNQKSNYLSSQIINSVVLTVEKNLDNAVNSEIVGSLSNTIEGVPNQLDTISSGFGKLSDGTGQIESGSNELTSGSNSLKSGISEAYSGSKTITKKVNESIDSLKNDKSEAIDDNTLASIKSQAVAGVGQTFTDSYKNQIGDAAGKQAAATIASKKQQLATADSSLSPLVSQFNSVSGKNFSNYDFCKDFNNKGSVYSFVSAYASSYLGTLTKSCPAYVTGTDQLNDVTSIAYSVAYQTAISAAEEAATSTASSVSETVAKQVATTAKETAKNTTIASLTTLSDGLTTLTNGLSKLNSGSEQLYFGSAKLSQGATTLNNSVKSSKNELDSKITSTKKDVKKVEKLSDYSKEPVKAETKEVNKVSSYGTAFAPLFISIALWVGSLMSFIVLFFDKEKRFGLFGIDSKKRVKRTLAYHGLATVSGLVLGLLLQLLLDFDITNVFLYYISIILISNCFLAIIEFLIECFGDIGKFVALIILVLQLGASGGTFPIETVTKGFRFLNPMLPMTYTIRLLKESLISIESSLLSKNFIIVFAIFIVFFIANVALNLYRERKDK